MDIERWVSHDAVVGRARVRRALPLRGRRTVGPWCFADHFGPLAVAPDAGLDVAPHPHYGLATVTWLLDGALLHRDSLGSEQIIRPGQVNVMTAGFGVSHSEDAVDDYRGLLEGVQLWLALSPDERVGGARFAHRTDPERLQWNDSTASVIVGQWSPGTLVDDESAVVGAEVVVRGRSEIVLNSSYEYGVVALRGLCRVDEVVIEPGESAYVPLGREQLQLEGHEATVIILGGVPRQQPLFMWWNFVGESRGDVEAAYDDWRDHSERFGTVASSLARIEAPTPWWITTP